MKNKIDKSLKRNLYRQLITNIVVYTIVGLAISFLSFLIYSNNIWYGGELYYFIFNRLGPLLFILYFTVGYVIVIMYNFNKVFTFLESVYQSVDLINDESNTSITLPSELSHIELHLNKLKFDLNENKRLAKAEEQRKNDLIVYLAHDIKTPLTSVIGYLSLLDEVKDMPQEQREKYLSVVLDKAYNLEDLINELFDIARYNDGKMTLYKKEVNLNLMVEQIIDDFYPLINSTNKNLKLFSEESINISVDAEKIARVISNVINNANNYSESNSTIEIKLIKNINDVSITISNIGAAISQNKLDLIFEKFYRIDSSRSKSTGGSGLGLAIAKDIVELHNGSISAKCIDNKTSFIITLPLKS